MESAVPPSYNEATARDPWTIIASYIDSADLCSASLVSRRWHEILAPCLWGNPASHFGTENDRVYGAPQPLMCPPTLYEPHSTDLRPTVALTRFKRTLPYARYEVRQMTHTLHLPPAQSELYDGPHPAWLRDVLERLPNLQSLIVSQLPFFDHGALLALRQPSRARQQQRHHAHGSPDKFLPTYPLRLLIGVECSNTTSAGLAAALPLWPSLVFLDLSDTLAARDVAVLASLRGMHGLQVLKLRHVGLRDEDVETLAPAIGIRVRSLDVRDNRLTDASVRALLSCCFHATRDVHAVHGRARAEHGGDDDDWPMGVPRPDPHVLGQLSGDDMDARFVRRLTRAVVGRIATEDLPSTGLTHLYIADNYVTVEALASLLRTENLHVLDAGSADTARALGRPRSGTASSITTLDALPLPRAEKLVSVLENEAARNLTYLRLHFSVVTEPAPPKDDSSMAVPELDGEDVRAELDYAEPSRHELSGDTAMPLEIDDSAPVYELSAEPASPRAELPGEPLQIVVSPAVDRPPSPSFDNRPSFEIRSGPAFAPEVVNGEQDDEPPVLTPTGLGNIAQAINGVPSDDDAGPSPIIAAPASGRGTPLAALAPKDAAVAEAEATRDAIDKLEAQRRELRFSARDASRGLRPGLVPGMRTLVLTEIPTYSTNPHLVTNLRGFLSDCAREHHLATSQAALESQLEERKPLKFWSMHPAYTSPGADRAQSLFALRRVVLEIAPVSSATASTVDGPIGPASPTAATRPRSSLSFHPPLPPAPTFAYAPSAALAPRHGHPHRAWTSPVRRQQKNYSSTEDPDTEAFWQAQEHDFSFFGDEECGLPAAEAAPRLPVGALAEKQLALASADDDDDADDDAGGGGTLGSASTGTHRSERSRLSLAARPPSPPSPASLRPPDAAEGREGGEVVWDVVAELAGWRAQRKAAWERTGREGFVEGYWPGEVKVVRPPPPGLRGMGKGGVDCYGNYFEKGFLYR